MPNKFAKELEQATQENRRTVFHVYKNAIRKPKTPFELRLARDIKGNKQSSYDYTSSTRIKDENVEPVLNRLLMSVKMAADKWKPVMSDVARASLLGTVLFNVFVRDMDSGIECTLSKFVDDTKLCGVVDMLEARDTIQRDLDRLERYQFWVLHFGHNNSIQCYSLEEEWLESCPVEKDQEVSIDAT
ncbi:rna-directed dna polymerase from mobile element jockey-like [Limosa lapponica baueri]|uniref:Rna-directed dna polymerase from mobile element jockey-like n=1 Tax=Limosa lapponica baueri TaxID=1758121 RepID=A0A2I0U6K6_LIMLA|nr:rna-directed dna polymerase from mobile element jockey-like [Limosa lapponica baueri]